MSKEVLDREFKLDDIVQVMTTGCGRRTIAAILELCMYEESAMATNATMLAANVSRQEIAYEIKNWILGGGGKSLWRKMEDITEITQDNEEKDQENDQDDDYDLASSLDD